MAHIGSFTRTTGGYTGRLCTLTLDVKLTLVTLDKSDAENAPDYRIHLGEDADGPEAGAGWKHSGKKAGAYVALLIDDPVFTQPIRANLFQTDAAGSTFHLLWNRRSRRKAGA
ncbi:MAG: DUF736 domain-containing protein [Alphaproteobacteria bacterium]